MIFNWTDLSLYRTLIASLIFSCLRVSSDFFRRRTLAAAAPCPPLLILAGQTWWRWWRWCAACWFYISPLPDSPLLSCTNILTLPLFQPDFQPRPTYPVDRQPDITILQISIKITDWQISRGIGILKILFICIFDCLETSLTMTKLVKCKLWLDRSDLSDSRV